MPGMMDTILNLGLNDATVAGARRADRQPAVRVGLLPPVRRDVRRGRDGRRRAATSTTSRRSSGSSTTSSASTARTAIRISTEAALREAGRRVQGRDRRASPARRSPTTSARSCGARSARCSGRGTTRAPTSTARCTTSRRRWAPRSTCRRWCSATSATTARPASRSRATRRPATAELYGEFLTNAQGEDVVAGIRTPEPIAELGEEAAGGARRARRASRSCSRITSATCRTSSSRSSSGQLCMLQTRSGKRTGKAMVKVAVDLVAEGKLTPKRGGAAHRSGRSSTRCCTRRSIRRRGRRRSRKGLPASPGAAIGRVVFTANAAEEWAQRGEQRDPRPHRDLARGHPRHEGRGRHPDRARRA